MGHKAKLIIETAELSKLTTTFPRVDLSRLGRIYTIVLPKMLFFYVYFGGYVCTI